MTVEVHANPAEWKAEASASWVTISDVTATSLTVEVIDNDTEGTREAEITVTSGAAEAAIRIVQVAKDYVFPRYRCHPEFQYGTAMSPSGRYAGGFYWEYDDESNLNCYPVVIDVATGEWTELGPYPQTLFSLFSTSCISDYGDLVIATENDGNVMFRLDGSYEEFKTPAGFTSNPQISQVAADGTWVGWCGKDGTSYPVKWVDGVAVELPKPALNYRDEPIGDVQARGISADGRIVYGTTWDNLDFGMVYWDEAGEVHYVGEDVRYCRPVERPDGHGGTFTYNLCDGMWTTATNTNVSPNGKYIAGTYRIESLSDQAMMELGATVCLPNGAPQCTRCPAAFLCRAHREGTTGRIPVKAPKKPRRVEERRVYLLFHKNAVALRRRSARGLLAGLWEYPNAPADEPDFLNGLGLAPQGLTLAAVGKHIFTHIEWHLTALAGELPGDELPPGWVWAELSQLREIYALPNAFQFAAPAVERRLAKTESEGGTAI